MHKQYYNQLPINVTEIHITNNNNIFYEQIKRILYQFQSQQNNK